MFLHVKDVLENEHSSAIGSNLNSFRKFFADHVAISVQVQPKYSGAKGIFWGKSKTEQPIKFFSKYWKDIIKQEKYFFGLVATLN